MKNKKILILRIIIIILILLWMRMVFGFSAQKADESTSVSMKVASLFTKDEIKQKEIEPGIRKSAHYTEYLIGGNLFLAFFLTFNIKEKNQIIFAIILGVSYAITDEIHQLFVDGRSGQFRDVCIDSLGVLTGVCIMKCLSLIVKKILIKVKVEKQSSI